MFTLSLLSHSFNQNQREHRHKQNPQLINGFKHENNLFISMKLYNVFSHSDDRTTFSITITHVACTAEIK